MTERIVFDALKAAFMLPLSNYAGADDLAGDCAEIALEALAELGLPEETIDGAVEVLANWQSDLARSYN